MINRIYTIKLKTNFFRENGVVVGVVPELNVSSYGQNLLEAKRALAEAVEGFLETCRDLGTLEDVLEEAGFTLQTHRHTWRAPRIVKQEQVDFKIAPAPAYA